MQKFIIKICFRSDSGASSLAYLAMLYLPNFVTRYKNRLIVV